MSTVLEINSGYNVVFTFIYIVNSVVSGEIYTTGKNFTLPPAVTAWTYLTSGKNCCQWNQEKKGDGEHLKRSSRT